MSNSNLQEGISPAKKGGKKYPIENCNYEKKKNCNIFSKATEKRFVTLAASTIERHTIFLLLIYEIMGQIFCLLHVLGRVLLVYSLYDKPCKSLQLLISLSTLNEKLKVFVFLSPSRKLQVRFEYTFSLSWSNSDTFFI